MASTPNLGLPSLAPALRSVKPPTSKSSPKPNRAFFVHKAGSGTFRVVVNAATGAVLDRLMAGESVMGGNFSIKEAVGDARAAGVSITTSRVPRTDGGSGHVALYRLAEGIKLEEAGGA